MAFFLRKRKRSRGIYLSICESYWDDQKKQPRSRSVQTLGYVDDLIKEGIADPAEYFAKFVAEMDRKRKEEEERGKLELIGESRERNIGYFLLKGVWNRLAPDKDLAVLQANRNFHFNVTEVLQGLVYARVVDPCSKKKTLDKVLPTLYENFDFSYDQTLRCIDFIGSEYEKIIEIFTYHVSRRYTISRDCVYFDCTNFYFEIDKQDDFRRKGHSKEQRHDPIVSMGLLLDSNMIPIAMRMFPGNESEQPVLREVIRDMKRRYDLTGKTIQVADKGLNSAANVVAAISESDGYIFSRGTKKIDAVEQKWLLNKEGYERVYNGDKLPYAIKDCVDDFEYRIEDARGRKTTVLIREKRVATFNPSLRKKKLLEIDSQVEKATGLALSHAKRSEYGDSSKYVVFESVKKEDGSKDKTSKVKVSLNAAKIELDRALAGYNLLVTSEIEMDKNDVYSVYHNLSEIEHSFRTMKSYIDARPVFLQTKDRIIGHFTICYLALLILRLLNVFVFRRKYSMESLTEFCRELRIFRATRSGWLNNTTSTQMISEIASILDVPINSFRLKTQQVNSLFSIILRPGH